MKKNAIIYGSLNPGVQMKAVEMLSQLLMDHTFECPVCFPYDPTMDISSFRCFYIGTKENNPYIAARSQALLNEEQAYHILVRNDTVMIEGSDDAGVLYGCMDFYNKYIIKFEFPLNTQFHNNVFETPFPDFEYASAPSAKQRGIWTWGHVIYDFRGFMDNMVRLKMNTLIIWNDYVPVNAREMVDYAHACGIKIFWGFAWGWDTDCSSFRLDRADELSENIFRKFEKEYAALNGDGIYFQSFTELETENLGGALIAEAVTDFVNKTSARFFEKYPRFELQFGLHAWSVKNRLEFIKKVDPRIRIIWENCGAFPFYDFPAKEEKEIAETKEFVAAIAALRGEKDKFGVVTKGFTALDWSRFEHFIGSSFIGTGSETLKSNRITRKSNFWKTVQANWISHADQAFEMLQTIIAAKDGDLYVTALVEDGMFEKNIMYPVALYSEMLWNRHADLREMIGEVSRRNYITFA